MFLFGYFDRPYVDTEKFTQTYAISHATTLGVLWSELTTGL